MNSSIQPILDELRRRFQLHYGTRLVRMVLYGSQARGDAEPGSDIDVLVVLKGDVAPCDEIARTEHDVADISLTHDVVVVCFFVSEKDYAHKSSPILLNIRREGIPL